MRRLFLLAFIAFAWPALAQNVPAPGLEYNEGPAIGQRWEQADSFLGCINAQVGTTYTVTAADMGCLITFSNGSAIAVTVPQAGTANITALKKFEVLNLGAGTVTFTPTTSTVNGSATKAYTTGLGGTWTNNGTNYFAW
jgi:hypothetical protein